MVILSNKKIEQVELQIQQIKKASKDKAEKLKIVSGTNIATEGAVVKKLPSKNALKTKMFNVTRGKF